MKQTFSLRRFWLLIRKHYTENRQNYLICSGIYLLFLAYAMWGCLRGEYPSPDAMEVCAIFAFIMTPIIASKNSFFPYIRTDEQVRAFTIPATMGEKFLFGVLNPIFLTALAVSLFEVPASIIHDHSADFIPYWAENNTIVGMWFAGLGPIFEVAILFYSTAILACTMAHKGNVAKPMFLIWAVLILIHAFPVLLLPASDGASVAQLNVPFFTSLFESKLTVGNTQLSFETERLFDLAHWHTFVLPTMLVVAAWFKFKEYQAK